MLTYPFAQKSGVHPIEVGDVARKIIAKLSFMLLLANDIHLPAVTLQMCTSHDTSSEAAIYAMRAIFEDDNIHAALLIDTANAFNVVNCQLLFIIYIYVLCPSFFNFVLKYTYGASISLFLTGEDKLVSTEGTIQSDSFAMLFQLTH